MCLMCFRGLCTFKPYRYDWKSVAQDRTMASTCTSRLKLTLSHSEWHSAKHNLSGDPHQQMGDPEYVMCDDTDLRCGQLKELIKTGREKREADKKKHADACVAEVKVVVEHHNMDTERKTHLLLVTLTSPFVAPVNKVIVIGQPNNNYHGWWFWSFYNGIRGLNINFHTTNANKGFDHIFIFKENEFSKNTSNREMHLLFGVNCSESIIISMTPKHMTLDESIVTKATAASKYESLVFAALDSASCDLGLLARSHDRRTALFVNIVTADRGSSQIVQPRTALIT